MASENDDFIHEIEQLLLEDGVGEEVDEKGREEPKENQIPPKTEVDPLKEALASHEDLEVIRRLCEGGKVPEGLRADLWKECLGVSRRPDALGSWSGPLDCENQDTIHTQCLQQTAKLPLEESGRQQAALDMEQVITFYCKSRNMRYSPECGWPELLFPFLSLALPRTDLFNCFYAIMAKYIPRDCKVGGRPFHLFRLLLLYHDPELCSFLDTKRLAPEAYLQPWVRSLFVSTCELEVVCVMWDHYLLTRDPFLVFFLALVLIVNTKEQIMANPDATGEELCATISALPCQLSADDMDDFFSLAQYYASRTPQSFRKDYHSLLFGSGRSLASLSTHVSHALCLPVSLSEVLEVNQMEGESEVCAPTLTRHLASWWFRSKITGSAHAHLQLLTAAPGMHYFVVDCRPVEHFSCGHLPGAFHLDANLLLVSPDDFSTAADRLCARVKRAGVEGGEHLCFLGSGREQEDQYANMVIAKFLQKSISYVSLARGGFLELVVLLGGRVGQVLEDYDHAKCQEFYSDSSCVTIRSDTSDSDSETSSSLHRQKHQTKGSRFAGQLAAGFREKSQRLKAKIGTFWNSQKQERHVSQSDRPSKRYRNVHADVFVIADEDEENETLSASSSEDDSNQMVNVSLFSTNPDVLYSFPCIEIRDTQEAFPSHLLFTAESLVVLRELSDRAGWARVKHRHQLISILKITSKKKNPDIITFKFGTGTGEDAVITHQLRFRIPNTKKATAAIKSHVLKVVGR